jgi:hypothetical protein
MTSRTPWAISVFALLCGAACGSIQAPDVDANAHPAADAADARVEPDALDSPDGAEVPDGTVAPFDVSCAGDTPPDRAVELLRVFGNVVDGTSNAPVGGASVEVRRHSDDGLLGSTTANDAGAYSMTVPTGGMPLSAYVRFVAAEFLPTNVYLPDPLFEGRSVDGRVTRSTDGPYAIAGIVRDPKLGTLFVSVNDCAGNKITSAAATISFSPEVQRILYLHQGAFDPAATSTGEGFGLGLNAPTGDILIGAEAAGIQLEARPCRTHAGERVFMSVHP